MKPNQTLDQTSHAPFPETADRTDLDFYDDLCYGYFSMYSDHLDHELESAGVTW